MKIAIYILIGLAFGVIVFNASQLEPDNWFQGDSSIAVFGILSGLCAILVLSILLISKKIAARSNR